MADAFEACFGLLFMGGTFLFPVALIVLVFVITRVMRKAQTNAYTQFATQRGLTMDRGGWFKNPTVAGAYRNFNMYLYTYTTGSGKNQTTWTSMVVYLPFQNVSHLRISREGFFTKITKAFGAQDIQIGDPAFDQAYIIKSDTPQFVPQILTPQLRGALLGGGSAMNVTVGGGKVSYTQQGILKDAGLLGYILDVLVGVAAQIVHVETPRAAPQVPQQQQPQMHPPPVSVCDNCGADLTWNMTGNKGQATCSYCGKTTTFSYGHVGFRKS